MEATADDMGDMDLRELLPSHIQRIDDDMWCTFDEPMTIRVLQYNRSLFSGLKEREQIARDVREQARNDGVTHWSWSQTSGPQPGSVTIKLYRPIKSS